MNARKHTQLQSRTAQLMALLLLIVVLLASCASAEAPMYAPMEEKIYSEAAAPPAARQAISYENENYAFDTGAAQSVERIVIKNASLTIVVNNPVKSMETVSRMADEMGGFVVSANMYQDTLENGIKIPRAAITIRIPAEKLNDGLARIKAESQENPLSENITSQDVTSEYTDLQSRLRNLESAEKQLAGIMESATKTEDVLSVYNQLVSVREQIEVIKGQIKYYEESAALSAISVDLLANEAVQPLTIGGWQPVGVAKDAIQALIDTFKFIVNAVIWIVIYLLPVLAVLYIVFVLPIRLIFRQWRKHHPSKKDKKAITEPPAQAG